MCIVTLKVRNSYTQVGHFLLKPVEHNDLIYYQFEQWSQLRHGVFTRKGGVSKSHWASLNVGGTNGDDVQDVRRNHELMYDALSVERSRACTVWLVHSADAVIVDGPVRGRKWVALADGMITDRADTSLVMRYADCTPIMYHDPVKGVIGLAHAGWRGTVAGVASQVVRSMVQAYGCHTQDIQAAIGPSIGPQSYQVGEEVVEAVYDYFGTLNGDRDTDPLITRDAADGTAYFNLWAANKRDLLRAGVEQVEVAEICTAQSTDEFFSHRAEKGKTGRFGAVISL